MPYADVGDQRLYYEIHGEGEPLLCVMGLGADTLAWALQVPAWSARFRTIVFDNRDVGQSSYAAEDYEIADLAQDALGLADHLGLDSFHLVGVSMGGAIAQEVAVAAPQRVRTLTLAVTFAAGGAWAGKLAELWAGEFERASVEERVDRLMLLCLSERFYENADGVAFLRSMILQAPNPQRPEGFARQLRASARHAADDRLQALSMPTHVIGAEHDILVPVWKARELAALVPGARYTEIPAAPHGLNLERAEEFNRAVAEFIAGASAVPA